MCVPLSRSPSFSGCPPPPFLFLWTRRRPWTTGWAQPRFGMIRKLLSSPLAAGLRAHFFPLLGGGDFPIETRGHGPSFVREVAGPSRLARSFFQPIGRECFPRSTDELRPHLSPILPPPLLTLALYGIAEDFRSPDDLPQRLAPALSPPPTSSPPPGLDRRPLSIPCGVLLLSVPPPARSPRYGDGPLTIRAPRRPCREPFRLRLPRFRPFRLCSTAAP